MCNKVVYGAYQRVHGGWVWKDNGTLNALQKENDNLRGHIRRLEKSNQALGEELHKLKNPIPKGWD